MAKMQRDKGARVEREIVLLHRAMGIPAERVPLSGVTQYQGNGEDVDIYPNGTDYAPLCTQVKGMASPRGCKGVLDALGEADALFLRFDAEPGRQVLPPTVVLPWRTWEQLLLRIRKP